MVVESLSHGPQEVVGSTCFVVLLQADHVGSAELVVDDVQADHVVDDAEVLDEVHSVHVGSAFGVLLDVVECQLPHGTVFVGPEVELSEGDEVSEPPGVLTDVVVVIVAEVVGLEVLVTKVLVLVDVVVADVDADEVVDVLVGERVVVGAQTAVDTMAVVVTPRFTYFVME